ncbi:hypothetical protein ACFFP0_15505 [Rhizobium puerariae]|uniref:Sugar transporter n=1 Tax=Rhizobium puerariae TaxID=1585791 RepID=A0ABV6AI20_9HYPH
MKAYRFVKAAGWLLVGSALLGAIEVPGAMAQQPAPAQSTSASSCFVGTAKVSDEEIARFLASPQDLLKEYPAGGLPLSTRVRSLAGSSTDTLTALIALLGGASDQQISAIGSGLARAARACAPSNPEYAAQIQAAAADVDNATFETAFLAGSPEIQTAALGAGGGAGGGASAIGGGGNPGGGVNGTSGGSESVESGNPTSSASNSGSRYFSSSGGGSTTTTEVSLTSAPSQ